jgi:hypothetical protein
MAKESWHRVVIQNMILVKKIYKYFSGVAFVFLTEPVCVHFLHVFPSVALSFPF